MCEDETFPINISLCNPSDTSMFLLHVLNNFIKELMAYLFSDLIYIFVITILNSCQKNYDLGHAL